MKSSIITSGVLALLLSNIAWAEDKAKDTFHLQLGANFMLNQETEIGYGTEGLNATLSVEDFLNMETDNQVFRADGYYRFSDAHRIEFSYYAIDSSGVATASRDFNWGKEDTLVSAGATVNSYLNVDLYKVNYIYSFYRNDTLELGAGAGLHITDFKAGLTASGTVNGVPSTTYAENASAAAPLPLLSFRLAYDITPKTNLNLNYDFLRLDIDGNKGNVQDTTISCEYQIANGFGVGAGINFFSIHAEIKNDDRTFSFDRQMDSGLLFVSYTY